MLMPDVTAILYDPEIGGGVNFQVLRTTSVRSRAGYSKSTATYTATGNIQPQEMSNQSSTAEDLLNESIVAYSTFKFQAGASTGTSITEADIIVYDNLKWRVTRVNDWSKWGYTTAYASRIRDIPILPPIPSGNNQEVVIIQNSESGE